MHYHLGLEVPSEEIKKRRSVLDIADKVEKSYKPPVIEEEYIIQCQISDAQTFIQEEL